MQREGREQCMMIFILAHPNLGLRLVLTLKNDISLTQLATSGPEFQQPASTSIVLHTQLPLYQQHHCISTLLATVGLSTTKRFYVRISQIQISPYKRVPIQEIIVSHFYLIFIIDYKLLQKWITLKQRKLKQKCKFLTQTSSLSCSH